MESPTFHSFVTKNKIFLPIIVHTSSVCMINERFLTITTTAKHLCRISMIILPQLTVFQFRPRFCKIKSYDTLHKNAKGSERKVLLLHLGKGSPKFSCPSLFYSCPVLDGLIDIDCLLILYSCRRIVSRFFYELYCRR